jgi:hypothetical protein
VADDEGDDDVDDDAADEYVLCVHEEILFRAREGYGPADGVPQGSDGRTCASTIFTDSMGGSYICTHTGMVMGEGLITLADRRAHAGALAEYGSDGEEECAENDIYVGDTGRRDRLEGRCE